MHTLQIWNEREQQWEGTDVQSTSYAWVEREMALMQLRGPLVLRIISKS